MVGFSFDEIRTRRNRICTTRFLNFGAFFSPAGKSCVVTKARTRPGGPDALPVILHGVLHFSRKALRFAPKGSTILLLVPTRFCGQMRRKSAWCGQNGRDETACFDPGGAQRAFGKQNSKGRDPLAGLSAVNPTTAGFAGPCTPPENRCSCTEISHSSRRCAGPVPDNFIRSITQEVEEVALEMR